MVIELRKIVCGGLVGSLVALLAAVPVLAAGQAGGGSVTVTVVGEEEEPIRDADVTIREVATGQSISELTTNEAGVAEATGLEFLEYEVVTEDGCRATSPRFALDEEHPNRDVIFVLVC